MSKQRLQKLYDTRRSLKEKIRDEKSEIRELREEKKRTFAAMEALEEKMEGHKQEIENHKREIERLIYLQDNNVCDIDFQEKRDLVKRDEIKWQDMSKKEWEKSDTVETLWEFKADDDHRVGIWVGLSKLHGTDAEHWEDYQNDYFYYGGPYFQDVNDRNHEMSECEMAFGSGEVTLNRYDGYEKEAAKEKAKNKFLEGASKEDLKKRCRELMEEAASMKKQKC